VLTEWIIKEVSRAFNNNPQGSQLRGEQKTDGVIVYKQILINEKLQTELTGRSPLRRRRSAVDCSAIEDEGEGEDEDEGEGEDEEQKEEEERDPGAQPSSSAEGTDFLPPRRDGENLTHLAPKLKKRWSYTSTPPLGFPACSGVKFVFPTRQ
jgi:hypothetical protein